MAKRAARSRLVWKLLGIIALAITIALVIVWLAIDFFALDYFSSLLEEFGVPQKDKVMDMFLDSVHRYLLWSGVVAIALALALSFVLIKMILRPLYQMIAITGKVTEGDYTGRVEVSSADEIGHLGESFNMMIDNLNRLEKLRKKMVIDVAHELRAPLTNIRGYLEALSDGILPPSKKILESLHQETLRLGNLAEDILSLSVADAARLTLERRKIDLGELLSHSLNLFKNEFAEKAIAVETRTPNERIEVVADAEKLAQVLQNLLDNAWKFTPHGGRVRVAIDPVPGSIKVVFANTGEPLSGEDLPLIFERFYRVEKSRSRNGGGAGIGLAIVKELVEAHGGKVGAENSGGYIRIWFTLPN
ncbi:MAG: HAMP domain-containing protein [Burkholderiales bacterium]|nr:HAMP domain-containing protein [Burkholderiales bacterium]